MTFQSHLSVSPLGGFEDVKCIDQTWLAVGYLCDLISHVGSNRVRVCMGDPKEKALYCKGVGSARLVATRDLSSPTP